MCTMIEQMKEVLKEKNSGLLERIKLYIANYERNRIAIVGYIEEGLVEIQQLLKDFLHDYSVHECYLNEKGLHNLLSMLKELKKNDILLLVGLENLLVGIHEDVCETIDRIIEGNFNLILLTSPEGVDLLEDFDEDLVFFHERLNGTISIDEILEVLPKDVRNQERLIKNIVGKTGGRIKLSFLAFEEFFDKCWEKCNKRDCDRWCVDNMEDFFSIIFMIAFGSNGWERLQVFSFKEIQDILKDLRGTLKGTDFLRLPKGDFEGWLKGKTIKKRLISHCLFQSGALKNLKDFVVLTPYVLDSFNIYFKWISSASLNDARYNFLIRTILLKLGEKDKILEELKRRNTMRDPYLIERLHDVIVNHCKNLSLIRDGQLDKRVKQELKIAESRDLVFKIFPFFVYTTLKKLSRDLVIGRNLFDFEKLEINSLKELGIISDNLEIKWYVFPYLFQNEINLSIDQKVSQKIMIEDYVNYINSVVFSSLLAIIRDIKKLDATKEFLFSVLPFIEKKAQFLKLQKSNILKSLEDLTDSEFSNAAAGFLSMFLILFNPPTTDSFNVFRSIARVETATKVHKSLHDINSIKETKDLIELTEFLLSTLANMFRELGVRQPIVGGVLKLIYGEEREHQDLYMLYKRFYEKSSEKIRKLYLTDISMPRVIDLYQIISSFAIKSNKPKIERIEEKIDLSNIQNVAIFLIDCFGWFRWHFLKREMKKEIIEDVVDIPYLAVFPTLTPVNIFSIITGRYPVEHGIIDQKILLDSGVNSFLLTLNFLENKKANLGVNVYGFKKFKYRELTSLEKSILEKKIEEVADNIQKQSHTIFETDFKQIKCYEIREKRAGSILSDVMYKGRLVPTYELNLHGCLDKAEKFLKESSNALVYFYIHTFDYLSHLLKERKQALPSKASYLESHIKGIADETLSRILSMNTNNKTLIIICSDHGAALLPTSSRTVKTDVKYPIFGSRIVRIVCDYPQKEKSKIMSDNPDVVLDVLDKDDMKDFRIYRSDFSPDLLVIGKDDIVFAKEADVQGGMEHGGISIGEIVVPVIFARR